MNASTTPSVPETTLRLVSEIIIPPDRQRENAKADESLVNSIQRRGLLNPICIRRDGTLMAGERRLDAHKQLHREFIEVRIFEELGESEAFLIELEENLSREQLTWQETCRAVLKYHRLKLAEIRIWTQQGTATDLGRSVSWVSKQIVVAEEMEIEANEGLDEIAGAASFQGAHNLISAKASRLTAAAQSRGLIAVDAIDARLTDPEASKADKTAALLAGLSAPEKTEAPKSLIEQGREAKQLLASAKAEASKAHNDDRIQCVDFAEWASSYTGPKFDVLHCDFPYGKDYAGSNTRKTGKATTNPLYEDSPDVLWHLVRAFIRHQDRFAMDQCHMIFWFDMVHYSALIDAFTREGGWKLAQPYPLVWDKNYTGVASDPKRRPRHCYETAFLFSRGDRKLVNLDNDIGAAKLEGEKLHTSQKPQAILTKWLKLVVDEHSAVLDPTCGSGSALIAALSVGAERVLGLEIDRSNADVATTLLKRKES